ncbi:MAG: bifunctional hydroxymethylpyrimidine kinase/phosphomethylpyrimidine kinase [Candidatus Dormibacter sp.]|uniref:bifunctional hydroxymethylpyrimidine kinase/phosphomethylpyrimidine kinase n=1 Tax=Candidatus Dormibacter sp. TaxID=2973982 RepID=UPI000DB57BF3|nr:MAG: bifunctional hydroxymethylpyrimidine kinase/phosphomethylpyrimidine kinase [Candidatus Dormibacteraeota bacterium]
MKALIALTIAGSDSGGGAGIQADLKTFAAFGLHGTSVITAVTAQNTKGVAGYEEVGLDLIRSQLMAVAEDLRPATVKTGMLASAAIIELVAGELAQRSLQPLVVDPVMVAKGGSKLLQDDAVAALTKLLIPLTMVLTPNLPEAEVLLGRPLGQDVADRRLAACDLLRLGCRAVVLKGGHAQDALDLYCDGEQLVELPGRRVSTANTHGSGCAFAAAVAARLALGSSPLAAAREAKEYIQGAVENALEIGAGHGPVNPLWRQWRSESGTGRL